MTLTADATAVDPLVDEHSVLLWQTCGYAEDLTEAAASGRRIAPAFDAMLDFLHYRLLPYLSDEELRLPSARLRDEHMTGLLLADHRRLRADVENVGGCRTRRLLTLATDALVERLERHVRREEAWVAEPAGMAMDEAIDGWVLPLLLTHDLDLDALPAEGRDRLVLRRLRQMRRGETVRLRAGHDLHPLWRRQRAFDPDSHVWVYEQSGPTQWRAHVTRRDGGVG